MLDASPCASLCREAQVQKLILISIVLASVVIPVWAARERNARRGLKKALFFMLVFEIGYVLAVALIYPRC